MKKYGLRIGKIGIEFVSIADRDKAIKNFTQGVDVIISDTGVRYKEGEGNFSVYDRDSKELITNCAICKGIFNIETCNNRVYPFKHSWEDEYKFTEGYICDACFAVVTKAEEVFNAKKLLNEE